MCGYNNQKQEVIKHNEQITKIKVVPRDVYDEIAMNNTISKKIIKKNLNDNIYEDYNDDNKVKQD
jgi:hypothetical protein